MNNYSILSLKSDLETVYANLKSTDDLYKLEDFMINAIEEITKEIPSEHRITFIRELNTIHNNNRGVFLNAIRTGNTLYELKEWYEEQLTDDYTLPIDSEKFITDMLHKDGKPVRFSLHLNPTLSISIGTIYDFVLNKVNPSDTTRMNLF